VSETVKVTSTEDTVSLAGREKRGKKTASVTEGRGGDKSPSSYSKKKGKTIGWGSRSGKAGNCQGPGGVESPGHRSVRDDSLGAGHGDEEGA